MTAYTNFAQVYDTFMDNVPYEEWSLYIKELLEKYNVDSGLVLELGCGTGNITELLAAEGYDMIGIDNAEDMLSIAMDKTGSNNSNVLYLLQDMREFELYGTVKAIVSVCDSMNYILEEDDLLEVFRLANNYLDPDGVFIFDLNTEYKYINQLGDNVFAENRDECSFIWENNYYEDESINEYILSIFVNEEDSLYRKYEETHYQKAYSLDKIIELINKSGLEYITAYDAFTYDKPRSDSDRIYVIAKEKGKKRGE